MCVKNICGILFATLICSTVCLSQAAKRVEPEIAVEGLYLFVKYYFTYLLIVCV